ncbi:MAG TPA: hemopexin repeat-containing protein, partial [Candidatus Nitrosocosmicus sp.]|nr:hemopexin repeat-containing protein [Candidatus Nitrosocosmicus sp.]
MSQFIRIIISFLTILTSLGMIVSCFGFQSVTGMEIDAALQLQSNGKVYFFKEDGFVRLTVPSGEIVSMDPGYPRQITIDWHGLPFIYQVAPLPEPINPGTVYFPEFLFGIDAALQLQSNGKVYFFKGDEFARLTVPQDGGKVTMDPGYPKKISSDWKGIPNCFVVGYYNTCKNELVDPAADYDKDGLSNLWETRGIDIDKNGKIDFKPREYGADPRHKDLFLEIDFMKYHKPYDLAIKNVVQAFANAPLTNPDGKNGINLHIKVNEEIPHQDTINFTKDGDKIKSKWFGTKDERLNKEKLKAKSTFYYYGFFGHSQLGDSASGIAKYNGKNLLISMGSEGWAKHPVTNHSVGSQDQQEGILMHEFGHNLGLLHGGGKEVNYKPNYLSVMNYGFATSWLVEDRPLDYSRCKMDTLNEIEGLSESKGIGFSCPKGLTTFVFKLILPFETLTGKPTDWNLDGKIFGKVRDMSINQNNKLEILDGYNDWNRIKQHISGSGSGDATRTYIMDPELTLEDLLKHRLILLDSIQNQIDRLPTLNTNSSVSSTLNQTTLATEIESKMHVLREQLTSNQLNPAINTL